MSIEDFSDGISDGDLDKVRENFEPSFLELDDFMDDSVLNEVVSYGTVEILQFLMDQGADIEKCAGTFGAPPITYAAYEGKLDMVRLLVEAGAKLDISHPSRNPLRRAVKEGHLDVVSYLLSMGIDPHATYLLPTGALVNAFYDAENAGHDEIVELLKSHGCRRPIQGVDVPLWEPPLERRMDLTPEFQRYRQIIEYMEERFGTADSNGMQELLPQIEGMSVTINIIQPNDEHPYWVLFTNGMSARSMSVPTGQSDPQFAELVMHLPPYWKHPKDVNGDPQWFWPLGLLRQLAYHPHHNGTWYSYPAAIVSNEDPAEPLGPNIKQTCVLLLPDFSNLKPPLARSDGSVVHFFTVVPLFADERDYELNHGMFALLEKLVEHEVPMTVDLHRKSFLA